MKSNEWKLVTTVFSATNETLEIYIDGELKAKGSTEGMALEDIISRSSISGYIGKSFYAPDPHFGGMIADFKVYDDALTETEISKLTEKADVKIEKIKEYMDRYLLEDAANKLDFICFINQDVSQNKMKTSLNFPEYGAHGTNIIWKTSNENIITNEGAVYRPSYDEGDQEVLITAIISDDENSIIKEFTVTVISKPKDTVAVRLDAETLKVYNIDDVRGNLTLPTEGENGSIISWTSADPDIITPTGEVTRPAHGEGDATVKLIATITLNDQSITKTFLANVKEMPMPEEYEGYLFTYFTGEGYENGEQIYFALSEGNDPLNWRELNNGEPVFISDLGEKGLRDPFIIRSPEGDKFYLIATDLKIHGDWDWSRAQSYGSRSIMVWESNDLINWSKQRMVEVAPPEAGNTWAPEMFYDHTTGEYIVFWASKIYDNEEQRQSGASHQRMMYTKTRDFYTFTEPKTYIDYDYSIIDTTMMEHEGKIYRFTKDERNNTPSTSYGKFIFQEVGDSVLDPNFELIKEGIGKGQISQGEGPLIFKSNTEEKWYMFIDEFGDRGYVPFETTNLSSGEWTISKNYNLPSGSRHGTVLPITLTEYEALQNNVPTEVDPVDKVSVRDVTLDKESVELKEGEEIQLKATITPNDADNQDLLWSSSDEDVATVDENGKVTAIEAGNALITVTTVDGSYIAVCEVAVMKDEDNMDDQDGQHDQVEDDEEDEKAREEGENDEDKESIIGDMEGHDGDDSKDGQGSSDEEKSNLDNKLPSTATKLYNYLILGISLLVTGSVIVLFVRKRKTNI